VAKLDALDSDERLGIGVSLFKSVVFEPRNYAVHDYELVDLVLVRKSVELANLTVRSLLRAEHPGIAPIFYGTIELFQGRQALEALAKHDPRQAPMLQAKDADGLWLKGIGTKGEISVAIDRQPGATKVLLVTSDGDRSGDVQFCPINQTFGTDRLKKLLELLERSKPEPINIVEPHIHTVVNSFINHGTPKKRSRA